MSEKGIENIAIETSPSAGPGPVQGWDSLRTLGRCWDDGFDSNEVGYMQGEA